MKSSFYLSSAGAVLGMSLAATSWATAPNDIALDAPVTIVSGGSSISNPSTPVSVVTDGIFAPESTAYHSSTGQSDAVEWLGATSGGAPATNLVLQINLGSNFKITGAIVQADDNDSYLLQYLNESTNTWQTLYNVPAVSVGQGLTTRPNSDQMTYAAVGPVVTDALRFSAVAGDGGYAVSEIEVQGVAAVPEPETYAMLLAGLGLIGFTVTRRKLAPEARDFAALG